MRRWAWIWLPLAFFVTCTGWALASPVGAAPDDDYHLASIWCAQGERGGVCVDPGVEPATLLVPAPVVQSAVCYAFKADVTADCQDEVLTSTELAGTQHINQIDGLYPGAYYTAMSVFVGPDVERSVTVMRLLQRAAGVPPAGRRSAPPARGARGCRHAGRRRHLRAARAVAGRVHEPELVVDHRHRHVLGVRPRVPAKAVGS